LSDYEQTSSKVVDGFHKIVEKSRVWIKEVLIKF